MGVGAVCGQEWICQKWDSGFIEQKNLSIKYLELYGVLAAVMAWIHNFRNRRIILHCDNRSVVDMINSTTSSCRNCMVLIHLLVLKSLTQNVCIFARHIAGKLNDFSDSLSRMDLNRFHRLQVLHGRTFAQNSTGIAEEIWPMEKIWLD